MALLDVCRPRCSRAANIGSDMASILCLAYLCVTTVTLETGQPVHPARVRPLLLTFMSGFFLVVCLHSKCLNKTKADD